MHGTQSDFRCLDATAAIKKSQNHLFNVLDNPSDANGRLELAQASTMAGIAFSNSMVGLVHSLGHALGAVDTCRMDYA